VFDYRYHALSLAAVLLALCIGLLLGVAIGDRGLASSAQETLRTDLRAEVEAAGEKSRQLEERLELRTAYEEETLPLLVGGRLQDARVAMILVGEPPSETFDHTRDVVTQAGGEVSSVSRLRLPVAAERIASAAEGSRYSGLLDDPDLLEPLGRRVGEQIAGGGRFLRLVSGAVFSSSTGSLANTDAIVIARESDRESEREEGERAQALIAGIIAGAREAGVPVVGVELTTTDPSQVEWYDDRGMASVDSVDLPSGRAALAFALTGAADHGAYGIKPSRDALLPEAVTRRP
jgi:hypothetical protein